MVRSERRMAVLLALSCLGLAGCTPEIPPPPQEGYLLVPRVVAGRLEDQTALQEQWAGALTPFQREQLSVLTDKPRLVGARQVTAEVSGGMSDAQRRATAAEIRARLPRTAVSVFNGGDGVLVVRLRYTEVIPKRCVNSDHWRAEDGLMPSGCALALTFGRMVSDPGHLVESQAMGPALMEPLARDAIRHSRGDAQAGEETGGGPVPAAGGHAR